MEIRNSELLKFINNLIPFPFFSISTLLNLLQICYAVCHMMGMSSACSNPILYGCLNENFWKEFKDILWCLESSADNMGQLKKTSFKKSSQKVQKSKPDLVTGADYQLCNTVSTDMTVLTKC